METTLEFFKTLARVIFLPITIIGFWQEKGLPRKLNRAPSSVYNRLVCVNWHSSDSINSNITLAINRNLARRSVLIMKLKNSCYGLVLGTILGVSIPVNAGTSSGVKCDIDMQRETVTCHNDKDRWTCIVRGGGEYYCTGKFAAWTTDCPPCAT